VLVVAAQEVEGHPLPRYLEGQKCLKRKLASHTATYSSL
jgi:hypothetical protein